MSVCIKDQIQNMNLVIGCTVGCPYCYARNNTKRFHIIDDFEKPEFFPEKLRMMEKAKPQNFLLTGMSDLAGWKDEWREEVFQKIAENPQHQFLFLSKRPDLLSFETDLENAWGKCMVWCYGNAEVRVVAYRCTQKQCESKALSCYL